MKKYLFPLAVLILLACSGTAIARDGAQPFAAKAFWQEFENDREKAEAAYIGKTLTFTGVVVETGMSVYMTPNVKLSDAPGGPVYLICVLPRADAGKLTTFTKGERVSMTGRVYRSKAGGGVVLKECHRVME